ncbi:MAG: adenosyl-hopene transferase HpnH [Dehalococcoidales bacterium]|nr:adenosyl-hopene transferase HpnH [Dehalococcoidales bacterium]
MIFPWQLTFSLARYLAQNKLGGRQRFPLVLMLEPTFRCNLACAGCGRIREDKALMGRMLSVEECLDSVDESGAPVICLTGGEPLLHPDIREVVDQIIARKRFIYLCSNGIKLQEALRRFQPSPYLSFVVHLDGLAKTHDRIVGRPGVFDTAIAAIAAAKKAGFQVRTNTTLYAEADIDETMQLFDLLRLLKTDGLMVAPGFSYEAVADNIFLSHEEAVSLFQTIFDKRNSYRFYNTPVYLEFLAGKRDLQCVPWSTPTRDPKGWKRPCYLIGDSYCSSFRELVEETDWARYGRGKDPRCPTCMVHSGFEASAIDAAGKSLPDLWDITKWQLLTR